MGPIGVRHQHDIKIFLALVMIVPFVQHQELCTWAQSAFDTNVVSNWEERKGDCLYLLTSLTTHSCDPNADLLDSRRKRTDVGAHLHVLSLSL